MVIRCKNCYKVLHHQERYCTRCGTESEEVIEIMKNGEPELSEWHKAKVALILCFIVSFLFTGVFSVILGLLYQRFNPNTIIDDTGPLPFLLSGFSRSYALLITGLASLFILSIVFYKNWLTDSGGFNKRNILYSLIGGIIFIIGVTLLFKLAKLHIIPQDIYDYLDNEVVPYSIIIIVLISYAIVEEFLRGLMLEGVNEVTIWPNYVNVLISGIYSVVFSLLIFFGKDTIIINFLIGLFMGHLYLRNKDNQYQNIIIRVILLAIAILL